jgi:hypothetical protein
MIMNIPYDFIYFNRIHFSKYRKNKVFLSEKHQKNIMQFQQAKVFHNCSINHYGGSRKKYLLKFQEGVRSSAVFRKKKGIFLPID